MGRYNSKESVTTVGASTLITTPGSVGVGYLGVFGTGSYRVFFKSGSFPIPDGVTSIRVRVVGAGGAGGGSGTAGDPGGTSSFGTLISATGGDGGVSGNVNTGTAYGGAGTGGDFQASGGNAIKDSIEAYGQGGAAAGSQLGKGGDSLSVGGAAVGGVPSVSSNGSSAFGKARNSSGGPNAAGAVIGIVGSYGMSDVAAAQIASMELPKRFPYDFFDGAGGGVTDNPSGTGDAVYAGGSGAGGAYMSNQGSGGGAGGGAGAKGDALIGGGGGGDASSSAGGGAGGGYAHGILSVVQGDNHTVTVGEGGSGPEGLGGDGLVIVEW
ncbi:hypothetical protein AAG587_11060 [Vreelandella neptunia]|uniref:hypothetical protein n=1 Tax=Vreelandella neptunia TaxID=115551 RepID=UPI00315B3E6B